jgi:hypothetical protein
VKETVKWGDVTFFLKGNSVAWIIIYREHVDFGFFRGVELSAIRLEGNCKGLRPIKIRSQKDINGVELTGLLKDAAKLENQLLKKPHFGTKLILSR